MTAVERQPSRDPLSFTDAALMVLEARTSPRVAADLAIDLYGADFAGPLAARVRDIGVGGASVVTESLISFRSIRRVRLQIPGSDPLVIDAEGRWQSDSRANDAVLTGLVFQQPDAATLSVLWNYVYDESKRIARFLCDDSDLSDLDADGATSMSMITRLRLVAAGRIIYRQAECGPSESAVYVVYRGCVRLEYERPDRRRLTLGRLGPGRLFGGLPLSANVPNGESAWADQDSALLEISRPSYAYLCVAKPLLGQRISQAITRNHALRMRDLVERLDARPDRRASNQSG